MKNFFSFFSPSKPTVGEILSISSQSPQASVSLAQQGVILSNFEDWLRIAAKAAILSPYSSFWREVALRYPEALVVKDSSLFFDAFKNKPLLADQVQAVLFSVSAHKLPSVHILRQIVTESDEQERVKNLLIKKKGFGDDGFVPVFLSEIISSLPGGMISFPVGNGDPIVCESDVLSSARINRKKRLQTLFGTATLIAERKKFYEESGYVTDYFILIDGEQNVRRLRETNFEKIKVGKKLRQMVTR